ncbi:FAD-binding oxidoreductase [Solirubrobacter sp. CPCC 204708]|uniref:FAD-binding oxidoreductase n=1 Tax=Solirubrobacter deserti TaxID=2282478 RepID=A0ABT4RC89_9ACTN|nr:FAD-binding oxidoreductase [Solirubrobacter deserti]MBE2315486.1 FAD-binding oxidoreductase [Solirubrobacter deserti]MDA0136126.1 FAD-binding oxidoreductase [Solirubrobacter deserti]
MTMIDPATALRDLCGGAVALPGDEGYDAARQAFNLTVDQCPAAVVYPADANEVAAVVNAAREAGLRVAPQTTGHNAAPLGDLGRTILLKTSAMGGVEIDAANRIARVGAGALWEDVVDQAAPHGLVALHGSSPSVGVAGYSLGGGMGWLARSHGLQANSITAIELVTADGEHVRTDAQHDPELFWALRGGGGNFGIVTALEFRLYPLSEVYAGFLLWDWAHAERVLTAWAAWAQDAPDHVTTSLRVMQLPPLEELPEFLRGRSVVMIDGAVQGDPAVLRPLRDLRPEIDTFAMVPAATLARLHQDPEQPMPFVGRSALVDGLTPEAIRALLAQVGPGSGSPLDSVELRQAGGALRRRTPGHGAIAGIDGDFLLFMAGLVTDGQVGAVKEVAIKRVLRAMEPWTNRSVYLNFVEHQVGLEDVLEPETFARLRAVRARVNPDGLVHANHAI